MSKGHISTNLAKRVINDPNEVFTFMVAGAAGDGIMSAGNMFVKILSRHSYQALLYTEYPSLIRGGHNTVHIRVGEGAVTSQVSHIDILFALNFESIEKHIDEVTDNGIIVYDPSILRRRSVDEFNRIDIDWRPIPLRELVAEIKAAKIVQNTIGVAAVCASIGIPADTYKELLAKTFGKKPKVLDVNLKAVDISYKYVDEHFAEFRIKIDHSIAKTNGMIISGNQAISAGLIAGGLGVFSGYPMSPATSILETMMAYANKYNFQVIQVEDEISAAMTAIGANHGGARAATATSGGGLSLMVEGIGLSASAEIPMVIIDVMRPGPSTGLPTWTGQADLLFAINLGQDSFPRIVLTPGDVEECYRMAIDALNYAEVYQVPVFILTDKWLGSSYFTSEPFSNEGLEIRTGKTFLLDDDIPEGDYRRFAITDDGVSPRAIPGNRGMMYDTTGNERDELGRVNDTADNRIAQMDKRMRKMETIRGEFPDPKIYGVQPEDADITIITWSSNKGIVLDLMSRMDISISMVHITHIWPFPVDFVTSAIDKSKMTILVEQNFDAQLGQLIRNHCLRSLDHQILRYDGRPLDPVDMKRIILEIMKLDN